MMKAAVPGGIGRSKFLDGFNHTSGGVVAREGGAWRDPIGVTGPEGEPIGRGAADDDVVDGLLELPDAESDDFGGIGLRRRRGFEVDLDKLGAVGFGGAVAD